jgi:hypothetical protein
MTSRAPVLFALIGLLLSASLAVAASEAPVAPPVPAPAAALPQMSPSTPAGACPAPGFASFLAEPQAASGACGACSDESCEGLPVFASCGPAGFRCLSQGTCGGGKPHCKCLLI